MNRINDKRQSSLFLLKKIILTIWCLHNWVLTISINHSHSKKAETELQTVGPKLPIIFKLFLIAINCFGVYLENKLSASLQMYVTLFRMIPPKKL